MFLNHINPGFNMILFGIVTYKEIFWECKTFQTLLHSFRKNKKEDEKIHVFVFDNTDVDTWNLILPSFDDIKLYYIHNKTNPGISFAYNSIAEYAKNEGINYITFLDQDTELPLNFYEVYSNSCLTNQPLYAPKIYAGGKLVSPSRYVNFRSVLFDEITEKELPLQKISCINTGMMIKTETFFMNKGYNPSLRLDFCDHEFIERLSHFNINMSILQVKINQNFSFLENTKQQDISRYRLFVRDLKVYAKSSGKETKMFFYVDLPRLLKLTFRHKTFAFFKIRLGISN